MIFFKLLKKWNFNSMKMASLASKYFDLLFNKRKLHTSMTTFTHTKAQQTSVTQYKRCTRMRDPNGLTNENNGNFMTQSTLTSYRVQR